MCREKGGARASVVEYMKNLEDLCGYKTLKDIYLDSKNGTEKEKDETADTAEKESTINSNEEVVNLTEQNVDLKKNVEDLKKSLSNQILHTEKYKKKMKVLRKSII